VIGKLVVVATIYFNIVGYQKTGYHSYGA